MPIMWHNGAILWGSAGAIAWDEGCCCGCASHTPATLHINLDSIISDAPAECRDGTADVGLNWPLPYDAGNDWWYGEEPGTKFGYKVWREVVSETECKWWGQPYCNGVAANAEVLISTETTALNPVDFSGVAAQWGNPEACLCEIEGAPGSVLPTFNVSITE
jgi:hypothetical protein